MQADNSVNSDRKRSDNGSAESMDSDELLLSRPQVVATMGDLPDAAGQYAEQARSSQRSLKTVAAERADLQERLQRSESKPRLLAQELTQRLGAIEKECHTLRARANEAAHGRSWSLWRRRTNGTAVAPSYLVHVRYSTPSRAVHGVVVAAYSDR